MRGDPDPSFSMCKGIRPKPFRESVKTQRPAGEFPIGTKGTRTPPFHFSPFKQRNTNQQPAITFSSLNQSHPRQCLPQCSSAIDRWDPTKAVKPLGKHRHLPNGSKCKVGTRFYRQVMIQLFNFEDVEGKNSVLLLYSAVLRRVCKS
jgi:hypothetical protein